MKKKDVITKQITKERKIKISEHPHENVKNVGGVQKINKYKVN